MPAKSKQVGAKARQLGLVDFIALSRDLAHLVQTGVYIVHAGRFVYVNPFFEKMTGYSADELTGRKSSTIIYPKDRAGVKKKAIRNLKSRRGNSPYEYRLVKKNGDPMWVLERITSITYLGNPATLGSVVDINERKHLEEDLARSEENYRSILDQMYDSYFELDLRGNFTFINDATCRIYGYSSEEIIGASYKKITAPEDIERAFRAYNDIFKSDTADHGFVNRVIDKQGNTIFVESSISLKRNESGEIVGFRSVARDITAHKLAEDSLRKSEERYRGILEQMFDSYYEVDLAGNFTFVNNAVCLNLGYAIEEMVGKSYRQFAPEQDIRRLFVIFNRVYTTGVPERGFVHGIHRKDGNCITVESSVDLRRDEKGDPIGFRSVVRDVTERTRLEEELQKLAAVVKNSNELVNIATMDGRMSYLNEAGSQMLGIDPGEIEYFHVIQVIPKHLQDFVSNQLLPQLRRGETWAGELQYINLKTGRVADVYASTFPIKDPGTGEPILIANVSRDISASKKTELALRESEERYRALFDRSMDLVWVRNFEGNFTDANQVALDLTGYDQEDMNRRNILEILTPDQRRQTAKTLQELMETGTQKEPVEYILKRKDGSYIFVEAKESVIYRDGKPYAIQGVGRDITERKLEEKRAAIQRDLATALNSLIPLKQAASLCLDAAIKISGMERGAIYVVDVKTGELQLFEHSDVTDRLAVKMARFSPDSPNARLILKGKPLYFTYSEITPPFTEQFSPQDMNVMAMVPTRHEGKVVACLMMASRSLDKISEPVRNALEAIAGEIGSAIARISYRESLQESERRYRFIADNTNDVIWAMDSKLRYTYISPSVHRQRGYTVEEALALNITQVINPEFVDDALMRFEAAIKAGPPSRPDQANTYTQEWLMYRKDGSTYWTESSITVMWSTEGRLTGLLGVTRDITDRKSLQQKLEEMATHDYLTGLPNRLLLEDRFQVASSLAQRTRRCMAMLNVDLDNFKPVNDVFGHAMGDLILKSVGTRLNGIIRGSDTAARIGGDEFLLMITETGDRQDVVSVADKVIKCFEDPFTVDGHIFEVSVSIGICIYPDDGQDLLALLKKSDDALYAAKKLGGNHYSFYASAANNRQPPDEQA